MDKYTIFIYKYEFVDNQKIFHKISTMYLTYPQNRYKIGVSYPQGGKKMDKHYEIQFSTDGSKWSRGSENYATLEQVESDVFLAKLAHQVVFRQPNTICRIVEVVSSTKVIKEV